MERSYLLTLLVVKQLTLLETEGVSRIARGWDFRGGTDLLESGCITWSFCGVCFTRSNGILKKCNVSGYKRVLHSARSCH